MGHTAIEFMSIRPLEPRGFALRYVHLVARTPITGSVAPNHDPLIHGDEPPPPVYLQERALAMEFRDVYAETPEAVAKHVEHAHDNVKRIRELGGAAISYLGPAKA